MGERCPRCGGALKAGAQWCGLCYADLRPPPPAPPAEPEPPAAAQLPSPVSAAGLAAGTPQPADLPDEGDVEPDAGPRKGWPCTECGALNSFELESCASCSSPFGSGLRTPAPSLPGDRRTRAFVALAVAAGVMGLIALLSLATGGDAPEEPAPPAEITVEG